MFPHITSQTFKLIDPQTGVVRPSPAVELRAGMTLAALEALRLPPGRNFDFGNGYTARGVDYLPYAGRQIYYSLKLHAGVLDAVEFALKSATPAPPFEVDPHLHRMHVEFLREQLGASSVVSQGGLAVTYRYPWGSVGAYVDTKGGTTSMLLRWSSAQSAS